MIKRYWADRDCAACGYGTSLRRAKQDSCEVTYDTDNPGHIEMRCKHCGNVRILEIACV